MLARFLLLSLIAAGLTSPAWADVRLPAVFSDGMVLQRDVPLRIWGRAAPNERVAVTLGPHQSTTDADVQGRWSVVLPALPAGGPHILQAGSTNVVTVWDVLIGEVWLGAGQSNMLMHVDQCDDAGRARVMADGGKIRIYRDSAAPSPVEQWHGRGRWIECNSQTVGSASAVLYAFASQLQAELGVPIGIIDTSISHSPIQSWISARTQYESRGLRPFAALEDEAYRAMDFRAERAAYHAYLGALDTSVLDVPMEALEFEGIEPRQPRNQVEYLMRQGGLGGLYNGKIAPLAGFPLRGFLWYQGEENLFQAPLYGLQLQLLVQDWRDAWGSAKLPFAWVQLPNFEDRRPRSDYPVLRECMRRALEVPHTGMVVTIDLGNPVNVHPTSKREVGERLARWALDQVYDRPRNWSGPVLERTRTEENVLVLDFSTEGGGLVARTPTDAPVEPADDSAEKLSGFEIAGSDLVFRPAHAELRGDSVLLTSVEVSRPLYARYAWASNPSISLFDRDKLPAGPFTTGPLPTWGLKDVKVRDHSWLVSERLPGR